MTAPTFLDTDSLTAHLGHWAPRVTLYCFETIDSTNTEAKRRVHDGDGPCLEGAPSLLLARTQTGGRGRLGRSFHSPASGLYMTLSYTTSRPLGEAVGVTAAAAVATAQAIDHLTDKRPAIKWVNDLYLGGGKLAGILTEAIPREDGRTQILVGIGVNLTTADFPEGLRAPAASLFAPEETGRLTPGFLGALAGEIACRLLDAVENPSEANARLSYYRDRLLYIGRRVVCTRGSESFAGTLLGVDADYSLLVEADGEVKVLSSGEISVRTADDINDT